MGKKIKPLEQCRTWKELEGYAAANGFEHVRTSGGHKIYKHPNSERPLPISTHEREPSKQLRSQVVRQIKTVLGLMVFLGMFLWIVF